MFFIFTILFFIYAFATVFYLFEYGFIWTFSVILFSNMTPVALFLPFTGDIGFAAFYGLIVIGIWYWIYNFEPFADMELYRALMFYYMFTLPIMILGALGLIK